MNARSSSGRTALGRDSAQQPSPASTAASGTGQQVYSSPQSARPASASSTQAARPAGASSTQAARPASASSPAASIGSSQLQLLHSQLRSQRKPANITSGEAAVGKASPESSSAVKAAASYTDQAGTQEAQSKPYQPPAAPAGAMLLTPSSCMLQFVIPRNCLAPVEKIACTKHHQA